MKTPAQIPSNLPQLAAQTTPDRPWPLRILSAKIAEYVSKMSRLWVEGEIITLVRRQNAKIQYFTLADLEEKVSINVKIFTHALPAGIESGSRVIVCAKPDFWPGNGSLSLFADEVRAVGIGDILARIEQLKQRLAAEGLFSASRKKPLPFLPRKIGLICGRNTKAMHDVVVNAKARWASAKFEIREVQVQGIGSVPAMLTALKELDTLSEIDVIVFARGGGSVEDLLPFSDEQLVRAVAAASTPVVSAIGHETDNPVLDFVADYRASTPTDAAKNIVPDVNEEKQKLFEITRRLHNAFENKINILKSELTQIRERPIFTKPEVLIDVRADELTTFRNAIHTSMNHKIELSTTDLAGILSHLRTLSPHSTISRGYSVLRKSNGGVITSIATISEKDAIEAILQDGFISLNVAGIRTKTSQIHSTENTDSQKQQSKRSKNEHK
ncbi:exodeoxyribonuclease VII large subunit [Arcanobacterium hippocoleae]